MDSPLEHYQVSYQDECENAFFFEGFQDFIEKIKFLENYFQQSGSFLGWSSFFMFLLQSLYSICWIVNKSKILSKTTDVVEEPAAVEAVWELIQEICKGVNRELVKDPPSYPLLRL